MAQRLDPPHMNDVVMRAVNQCRGFAAVRALEVHERRDNVGKVPPAMTARAAIRVLTWAVALLGKLLIGHQFHDAFCRWCFIQSSTIFWSLTRGCR